MSTTTTLDTEVNGEPAKVVLNGATGEPIAAVVYG